MTGIDRAGWQESSKWESYKLYGVLSSKIGVTYFRDRGLFASTCERVGM